MIEWYGVRQLIDLPGVPSTPQGISKAARKNNWKSRPRAGKGGGKEYHISALPPETQAALGAVAKPSLSIVDNTGKTPPTFTPRDENGLTPDEVAMLELYRQMTQQQKIQAQTIVHVLSQPEVKESNDE